MEIIKLLSIISQLLIAAGNPNIPESLRQDVFLTAQSVIQKAEEIRLSNTTFGNIAAEDIETRKWNSKVFNTPKGKKEEFHVKWIHWLDADNTWKDIDTEIIDKGSYFSINGAPFKVEIPKISTDTAKFIVDNRWDIFQKKEINELPFTQTIRARGVASVSGIIERGNFGFGTTTYVIYPNAYPLLGADLIYYIHYGRAPNLQKLIRFNTPLLTDKDFEFEIGYSNSTNAKRHEGSTFVSWDKNTKITTKKGVTHQKIEGINKRSISFKDFKIWDSKNKKDDVLVTYERITGETYLLTKKIPASFFSNATLPIYSDASSTFFPDPDVETTSFDGSSAYSTAAGGTFAEAHDAAAGTSAQDSTGAAGGLNVTERTADTNLFDIVRTFYLFDTSSLPDTATIDSATFRFAVYDKTNTDNDGQDYVNIFTTTPASNTALITADFDQIGTTQQATSVDFGSLTSEANNTLTLNATGLTNISKTSITKFGMREGHDSENSIITTDTGNTMNTRYAETAGTGEDPMLTVVYTEAAIVSAISDDIIWFD